MLLYFQFAEIIVVNLMKAANYHVIVQMEGPVLPMGVFAQMGGLEWIVLFHKVLLRIGCQARSAII